MTRPRLSDLPLWERHEARVLAILKGALELLHSKGPVGEAEPDLNRELFLCILDVNRRNKDSSGGDWFDYPPAYEARNPPTPGTHDSQSEKKIPDLCWGYVDHEESDPRRSARNFVIECKRLGLRSSAGWAFNRHYVEDGVVRFAHPDWRYGKDVGSGAMVGYIQSMRPDEILTEVNAVGASIGMTPISFDGPAAAPLHALTQTLDRAFEVTPFQLSHLWIETPVPTRPVGVAARSPTAGLSPTEVAK